MSKQISFKLEELAKLINGEVVGDSNAVVDNLSTIQNANSSSIKNVTPKEFSPEQQIESKN